MTRCRPPRFSRRLLSMVADASDRPFILSDLDEELERRAARDGERKARAWYREQVLRSVLPCLGSRARRRLSSVRLSLPKPQLSHDARVALRSLAKNPLVAVVTVVSLGLGIGAATTVFTVVNALLLRPPEVSAPETLIGVSTSDDDGEGYGETSFPDYRSVVEQVDAFEAVTAFQVDSVAIGTPGLEKLALVERVTGNYFDVLGVRMFRGRGFQLDEAVPEHSERVIVIGYRLWRDQFEENGSFDGREVELDGEPYTIVGVAPKGMTSRDGGLLPDAWIPIGAPEGSGFVSRDVRDRRDRAFGVLGRLSNGATIDAAQAQLDVLAERLHRAYPEDWEDDRGSPRRFTALSEEDARYGPELRAGLTAASTFLLGAAGLVLLLACANVAGLFLARAHLRRREIAIRISLGASRARLLGMLLVESLLLAAGGGALGVVLARGLAQRISSLPLPIGLPLNFDFSLDYRVLGFVALLSALTTLAFGLIPALEASRVSVVPSLKSGDGNARPGRLRLRSVLVVAQLAASVVLLVGAGLFFRAIEEAASLDLGLETGPIAVMSKAVPDRYENPDIYVAELSENLTSLPEVSQVHVGRSSELSFLNWKAEIAVPGYESSPEESTTFHFNSVTPGYLEMLRVPLVRGRTFTRADVPGAPAVAVVNESFARRFWDEERAVGQSFSIVRRQALANVEDGAPRSFVIIGVVRDGRYPDIDDDPEPFFWTSLHQDPSSTIVLHLEGRDADALVGVLRREVKLDPGELTLLMPTTLTQLRDIQLLKLRVPSRALSFGGAFGLVLAIIGIYGLVSFAVTARRREIAIRMAVGAGQALVVRSMVLDIVRLASIGFGLGCLIALPIAHLLRSRLYGVGPFDAVTLSATIAVLLLTALLASYVPARRAARVEPVDVLRQE